MNIKSIPNILTTIRIALIPLFIVAFTAGRIDRCKMIFVLSGISDIADGYIARKFHAESDLGKILDPIADKLTYATVFFCLCADGKIPVFFAVGFAVIQLFQGIGALWVYKNKNTVVKSNIPGKIAGFSMFALCIINLVFYDKISNTMLISFISLFVLAIIACSGAIYFIQYFDVQQPDKQPKN